MKYLVFIFVILLTSKVFAFTVENDPTLSEFEFKPIEVTEDAVSWKIFATTKEIDKCIIDSEGFDDCRILPKYSDEVLKLNGQEVTIMGFMFPLTEAENQTHFLVGPYPHSCPFEYHSPPSQIVEVIAKTPLKFSFDPIKVTGRLEVKYNKDTGVFYYLHGH